MSEPMLGLPPSISTTPRFPSAPVQIKRPERGPLYPPLGTTGMTGSGAAAAVVVTPGRGGACTAKLGPLPNDGAFWVSAGGAGSEATGGGGAAAARAVSTGLCCGGVTVAGFCGAGVLADAASALSGTGGAFVGATAFW